MKIQLAIDLEDVDGAIKLIKKTKDSIDIFEYGTPLVINFGLEGLAKIRKQFPDITLLADLKIMDVAAYEVNQAVKYGADYIGTHTGYDLQAKGETPFEIFALIKENVKNTKTAIAGGIKLANLEEVKQADPDLLIVGGGISSTDDPTKVAEELKAAKHVFVYGGGRSGLGLKGFAMRLVQMGKTAYVVGETTTPAITADDLLIVASASGTTKGTVNVAKEAQRVGSKIWLWSTNDESPLAQIANQISILPGKSKNMVNDQRASQQPMGSLFEQSVWLFGDAVTLAYMQANGITKQFMKDRHANLE